jgi:hypothetical protein
MLKTNTIRNKDSAGFSTKSQMSVYLPLFAYYLDEYLQNEQSKADPLRGKYELLFVRIRELLKIVNPDLQIEKISEQRVQLGRHLLKWKVDLLESEDSWVSWFKGITNEFLSQSRNLTFRTN